jgi:hypothetical protein
MRGKLLKLLSVLALMVGSLLIWSGVRVSNAIHAGALEQPKMCFDARHLKLERDRVTSSKIVDQVLTRQVGIHYLEQGGNLSWHLNMALSQLGWSLFWSDQERRVFYRAVTLKMKACINAEERLERFDRTGRYSG